MYCRSNKRGFLLLRVCILRWRNATGGDVGLKATASTVAITVTVTITAAVATTTAAAVATTIAAAVAATVVTAIAGTANQQNDNNDNP